MSEKEARFPEDISYGSIGGPAFSTNISELTNGIEQRRINWTYPRCRYNVIYGVKSHTQLITLVNFFYAHRGRALPFRFKDWTDYKATKQNVGIGNGKTSTFHLVKNYQAGNNSYIRAITRPVEGSVKVYSKEPPHDKKHKIDFDKGIIEFNPPPDLGELILADFEFDVLVRFDTDFLACSIDGHSTYGCTNIPLIEIKSH